MKSCIPVFICFAFLAFPTFSAADPVPSPTRLFVPRANELTALRLTNDSDSERHYVLEAVRWEQGDDGTPLLTPTTDLSISPTSVHVAPGSSFSVEIRAIADLPAGELAYRIVIRRAPENADPVDGIQIVPVIDLPVFVGQASGPAHLQISGVDIEDGALGTVVQNDGQAFARPKTATLVGYSSGNDEVFREEWEGWYILAGTRRRYIASIPVEQCLRIASFSVELRFDETPSIAKRFNFNSRTCEQLPASITDDSDVVALIRDE